MLNANLMVTLDNTKGKALANRRSLYAGYVANIRNEDTANTLADILYTRDSDEVNAIRMAYLLSTLTDEDGKAEEYKGAVDMIIAITGLKKSMVSNYRIVGKAFFTDDKGDFDMPDCLKGFTVTQLTELLLGVKKSHHKDTAAAFAMEMIMSGEVTADMSAKSIRGLFAKEVIDTTAKEVDTDTADTDTVDTDTADTADTAGKVKERLYLIDENGNRIAEIVPMNGYTIDGFMAMGTSGVLRFERG